ncbi:hypothetical protein [Paenibacillus sp. UNC499MF]|uniref:hypothetical protein n=1 Tax=unclassified Paenibacillus TaxID=185978 RepID=UPI0008A08FF6|nr:hypothetical protein [Paenibacillus sp. UNC499MF]SEG74618.1 hypothetical protein SAMN02799616_04734 [Paenibacillus sp. UNC499MF]
MGITLSLLIGMLVLLAASLGLRKPKEFDRSDNVPFRPFDDIYEGKRSPTVESAQSKAVIKIEEKPRENKRIAK